MDKRNRYLTGFLLLLIGILIGGAFVMFQQGDFIINHTPVRFTEIKKSEKPLLSDEDLEKIDDRFLFKNVADRVIPTVVYISTIVSLDDNYDSDQGDDDHFWDHFRGRRARTIGSGVIVSDNGYIVTNNHVIHGAIDNEISIILNDKRTYKARIVGTDPTTDLAILKIDAHNLPAIIIGNSDEVDVGEWVLAVGNPFRLRSTVTAGIVSALGRQVQISGEPDSQLRIDSFIQTDAAINKGNSGGALVNTSGELVGINTAIATQSGSYQGYGFAVPSNLVSKVMGDLIEYGEVHRALLGVSIMSIDYNRAQELGLDTIKGVEIRRISKGGAADRQGLQTNDVILSVDGNPVNESNELQERIAVHQPGDQVHLKIWRNNTIVEKEVKLGRVKKSMISSADERSDMPDEQEQFNSNTKRGIAFGSFSLGFKVMALSTPEDPEKFDLIIARVYSSTEAASQGLKEGYMIRQVNGKKVQTMKELKKQIITGLKSDRTIMLQVESPEGAKGYYELKK